MICGRLALSQIQMGVAHSEKKTYFVLSRKATQERIKCYCFYEVPLKDPSKPLNVLLWLILSSMWYDSRPFARRLPRSFFVASTVTVHSALE